MEFTKEQLIARAEKRKELVAMFPDSKLAQMDLVLAELALAMLTARPFMYGIADPAGGPHFAEFCVSGNLQHIEKEVETQNAIEEIDVTSEPHYSVAPLFRLPEFK